MAMMIKDISRIKGREVITVKPNATIAEAIRLLINNKIGAMPVCDYKGVLLGIISERDIIRWLHRGNTDIARTPVKDIMSPSVITGEPDDSLEDARKIMTEKGIRHLPVMVGKRAVGMLSSRDILEEEMREDIVVQKVKEHCAEDKPSVGELPIYPSPFDPAQGRPLRLRPGQV